MTIKYDQSDDESLGVSSPQGNISPIHATTLNTHVSEQKKTLETKEQEREKKEKEKLVKEINVDFYTIGQEGPYVLGP